ncbi:YdcF family protein [Clostridium sp.]|uniref:YdcF family protein n=1 Tax=Clostridium sp. TaxID=1506 RepID=UPI0032163D1B
MNNIDEITKFIFLEDKPEKADIIFIPGASWPQATELAAKLWNEGYAPYLLPSGRYSTKLGYFPGPKVRDDIYNKKYETEWEFMRDVAMVNGVRSDAILKEDMSTYTIENAIKTREVTDAHNLTIRKAIICCKAFHARRCLMLYSWFYPETEFIICPVMTDGIDKFNWYKSDIGIKRVMGELSRCGNQLEEAVAVWSKHKD